jgi:hypothetical protein
MRLQLAQSLRKLLLGAQQPARQCSQKDRHQRLAGNREEAEQHSQNDLHAVFPALRLNVASVGKVKLGRWARRSAAVAIRPSGIERLGALRLIGAPGARGLRIFSSGQARVPA